MKTISICEKQRIKIKSFHFDKFCFNHTGDILFNDDSHTFLNLEKASLFIFQKK